MPAFACLVQETGPAEDGEIYVRLRAVSGEFDNRWFKAYPSLKREMLATALTGISTGFNVNVELVSIDEYAVIERLFVRR